MGQARDHVVDVNPLLSKQLSLLWQKRRRKRKSQTPQRDFLARYSNLKVQSDGSGSHSLRVQHASKLFEIGQEAHRGGIYEEALVLYTRVGSSRSCGTEYYSGSRSQPPP